MNIRLTRSSFSFGLAFGLAINLVLIDSGQTLEPVGQIKDDFGQDNITA